ncbi:TonB-dependent siderophore receptor [Pseudomonas poae]|uniref:TonB-dependent siderophore receptor n=1 Tax=Pseudomonas poae TaxID=200451 RepID=A0A2S9EAD9_9PSED|nr:TonB-dependent receptor [Pseudomonas poae]PRA22361.1 TonB-dependent siderophore receptor [Pseudomonas poae]PRC11815.1 TonB-dependent siderophore receptor [Pseudomonas poae]
MAKHPQPTQHWRAAALACTLLMGAVPVQAAPATGTSVDQLSLNIPAQQLRQALLVFSQQSGQNVLLDGNLDGALRSSAVVGVYSPEQALAELLKGSGYGFSRTDAVTLYLVPLPKQADGMTLPAIHIQDYAGLDGGPSVGYIGKPKSTTTKLGLTDKQTPQAVTVVTREQMDDFKLNSVKEALRSAPSVTVEQFETDRTAFTSRGFKIENFEFDGMGLPFSGGVLVGEQDMTEFEQVDVLHGANGLMSGAGDPSATVNLVRKRPTDTFQARIDASGGSWDNRRLALDVSGPLTDSGNVRGRFITSHDKGNSYLDHYSHEVNVMAGLLAFDLSDADTLTVGFSQQDSYSNGSTWGGLPIADYAGNRIHYSNRSSSVGQPWTYWNIQTQRAFAELTHAFDNGWTSTLTVSGMSQHSDTKMLYAIPISASTVAAYINRTTSTEHQVAAEGQLSGPFNFLGREHELTLGANYGRLHHTERGHYRTSSGNQVENLEDVLAGNVVEPEMNYTDDLNTQLFTDRQKSLFAGARFSLTDDLHWIAGARMLSADGDGMGYGSAHDTRVHGKVTPYTGLVYDLNPQWSVYTSWTEIFKPQYLRSTAGGIIEPLEGKSMEVGIKGRLLDERLGVTAAVFKTEQQNVAEATGAIQNGQYLYRGVDYKSRGVELEANGELLPGLSLAGGYTYVHIEDNNGDKARQYVPTHSVRGSLTYRLPGVPQAKVGSRVQWQSHTEVDSNSRVYQSAYALVDLMGSYDFDEHWSTSLNLNNLTNQKYLLSLYQAAGSTNYGAPRNLTASVTWKY